MNPTSALVKRIIRTSFGFLLGVGVMSAHYYIAPYIAVYHMQEAFMEGDALRFSEYVQWDQLRNFTKKEITTSTIQEAHTNRIHQNSSEILANMLIQHTTIDSLMTPRNLVVTMGKISQASRESHAFKDNPQLDRSALLAHLLIALVCFQSKCPIWTYRAISMPLQ